jgi:precorrin-2/cobalt-factor-2 C20-methyltransferase
MRLIGVGVGPGDPEHLTLKALRALREADRVFVPEGGRAAEIVAAHVPVEKVVFGMSDAASRDGHWDRAGAAIAEVVRTGTAAFATIGDPNVYSTFSYLAQTVRNLVSDVEITTVPGITAMQDLAARSGVPLVEGTEPLTLLPLTGADDRLAAALADDTRTVVAYKGGRKLAEIITLVDDAGRLDDARYGAHLGLPDEQLAPLSDVDPDAAPYLSTVLVPARRTTRGGNL